MKAEFKALNEELRKATDEIYRLSARAENDFVREQFINLLVQLIDSGDLERVVTEDSFGVLTYQPFRKVDKLERELILAKSRIAYLELRYGAG